MASNNSHCVYKLFIKLCDKYVTCLLFVQYNSPQFLTGFPHTTVESYTEEIKKLLTSVFTSGDSPLKADDSVILMIHNGPDDSSTSVDLHLPSVTVNSGVPYVGQFLKSTEAVSCTLYTLHNPNFDTIIRN